MKRLDLDKILVFDLELECWNNISRQEQSLKNNIIEIGVSEVSLIQNKITKTKSFLVKKPNLDISEYCTQLTGITLEQVLLHGEPLSKVSKEIRKTFGNSYCYYVAWGDDNIKLKEQCETLKAVYPFFGEFLNLQNLFSIKHGLSSVMKQSDALKLVGIESESQIHRAGSDSINAAKLLLKTLKN